MPGCEVLTEALLHVVGADEEHREAQEAAQDDGDERVHLQLIMAVRGTRGSALDLDQSQLPRQQTTT